jgi:hypothetical protein
MGLNKIIKSHTAHFFLRMDIVVCVKGSNSLRSDFRMLAAEWTML